MRLSTPRVRGGLIPLAAAVAVAMLAACAPPSSSSSSGSAASGAPIVIGASLPLSGALAGFGSFQKWGYERAVKEANDAGGITVDGSKRRVELKLVDDKTDPNQVTTNIKTLISNDKSVGLLGSCTPDLVNPGAVVADSAGVPFVTGCDPLEVFRDSGVAMILVEQNIARGLSLAERAYVLAQGEVALSGTAAQVRDDPALAALYVGEAQEG